MDSGNSDLCAWTEERLELFLDGELSGSENLRFQTHLKECDECAAYWADDEAISEALLVAVAPEIGADAGQNSDPDFVKRVLDERSERPITHHSSSVVVVGRNPFFWSTISAVAASLITAFLCFGLINKDIRTTPQEVASVQHAGAQVGFSQGHVLMRPIGASDWQTVADGARLVGRVDLKTDADSRLLVRLEGSDGQFLLGEKSELRIESLPTSASSKIEMELDAGRLSCDFGDVMFLAGTLGIDINGRNASFDLTRGDENVVHTIDARLTVTRGQLVACADIGAERTIKEGGIFAVKDGLLLEYDRLHDVENVHLTRGATRRRSSSFLDVEPPAEHSGLTASQSRELSSSSEQLDSWLRAVVGRGYLNLAEPDSVTSQLFKCMRLSGNEGLEIIRLKFANELDPLRRRALGGLAGAIHTDAAIEFLRLASNDPALTVRKAAVFGLSRSRNDLSQLFLSICLKENDRSLRLSAAFLAAMGGQQRGFDEMIAIYRNTKSTFWRDQIVQLAARVEHGFNGRASFFVDVIRNFSANESREVLVTALDALQASGQGDLARRAVHSLLTNSKFDRRTAAFISKRAQALRH